MRPLLLLLLCLYTIGGYAQTADSDTIDFNRLSGMDLTKAFRYLDKRHGVAFSYSPQAVQGVKVPDMDADIKSVDAFLELTFRESNFDFEVISSTYVIIPKRKSASAITNFAITGVVRDRNTKEALPYAAVNIIGTKYSTTSNTDGKFTLLNVPSDTSSISVTYLGYMPLIKELNASNTDDLLLCEMTAKQRNLPSVEITATTAELIKIDPQPGQLTFNPAQIENLPNLGEKDLFAALRWVPGIKGGQDPGSGLSIRGGGTDQNLIMFDGITVYHVDHFFGLLSAFNSNVVKNVQVSKGGYNAKYGGRAAGLVNITAIDGNKVKPGLLIEATALSLNVRAELPIVENKASVVFAYRKAFTNIIQSPTYRSMFRNIFNASVPGNVIGNQDVFDSPSEPDFSFSDLNAKFNFKPSEKDAITFSYYQGIDRVNIFFDGRIDQFIRQSHDDTRWGTTGGSFKWSRKWNKRFFTYANYSLSRYKSRLEAEENFFRADSDTIFAESFFDQNTSVNDDTGRIDNTWEINPLTKLDFGYWYSDYEISLQQQDQTSVQRDSVQQAQLHAGYVEMTRKLGKLTLDAGLRISYYDLSDEYFVEPRLSGAYAVNNNLSIKASYGIFHQIIRRLNERSLYFSQPETWALADDQNIPVLRNDHYMIGFNTNIDGWQVDLEAYHKFERGSTEFLYPGIGNAANLNDFGIGGNRSIFGADVLLKKSFGSHHVIFGYTYLNARSRYANQNLGRYFRATGISNNELNFVYNFEYRRWDFSAGFLLADGVPYTPVLGTFVLTLPSGSQQQSLSLGGLNSEKLDLYHRLDLSVGYTLPLKKAVFQVGASAYNVYNHQAIKFIDYFTVPEGEQNLYRLGERNVRSLGFTPSIFLKFKI